MYSMENQETVAIEARDSRPISVTQDETIDALVEIHCQLSAMAEFLFGDEREPFERPQMNCFEDAIVTGSGMAKYALERIMAIKTRLGA